MRGGSDETAGNGPAIGGENVQPSPLVVGGITGGDESSTRQTCVLEYQACMVVILIITYLIAHRSFPLSLAMQLFRSRLELTNWSLLVVHQHDKIAGFESEQ